MWNRSALAPVTGGTNNRLDSLFDRVFNEDTLLGQTRDSVPMSIWQDDDNVYVEAELPGMTDRDVDITIHNGMLSIRGERKAEDGRRYVYNGRPFGRFERVITLPEAVNSVEAQAKLTDGVLSITLPKSPEAKPKKIAIQTT